MTLRDVQHSYINDMLGVNLQMGSGPRPPTREQMSANIKQGYIKVARQRAEHITAMMARHGRLEWDCRQHGQTYVGQYNSAKYKQDMLQLGKQFAADWEEVRQADEDCERELGHQRRKMHESGINYCETCFKLTKVGVRSLSSGVMEPLAAQYCEDCARHAPHKKKQKKVEIDRKKIVDDPEEPDLDNLWNDDSD